MKCGAAFDRNAADTDFALSREGGHRKDRILHASGDATGREIVRTILSEVELRPNIRIWENTFALDLLTDPFTTEDDRLSPPGGRDASNRSDQMDWRSGGGETCRGAIVYWKKRDEKELVWAKQTILATGGIGQIYRETTNPEIATADGVAMAYRAGAEIRDMEFVQFHPTVLYIAGSSRHLITEAMRGEGAWLVDRQGYRFMFDYDERGELAPRDIVSKAIVEQMAKTHHPNVYLDLTHKDRDWIYQRFPGIASVCQTFGIDIAKNRIPVRPGAHYAMGGVRVDRDGRSTLPGLWAVGEVSSTGLHGANRLASNSLLEALVYGESAGRLASEAVARMNGDYLVRAIDNPPTSCDGPSEDRLDLADIRNALKSLLWRQAGVVRSGERLAYALEDVKVWTELVGRRQFTSPLAWELQNMLTTSRLVLEGALDRRESRGAHTREDFSQTDPVAEHTILKRT